MGADVGRSVNRGTVGFGDDPPGRRDQWRCADSWLPPRVSRRRLALGSGTAQYTSILDYSTRVIGHCGPNGHGVQFVISGSPWVSTSWIPARAHAPAVTPCVSSHG